MSISKITSSLVKITLLALFITKGVFAEDIEIIGSKEQTVQQVTPPFRAQVGDHQEATSEKTIQLLHVKLSDKAKVALVDRARNAVAHTRQFSPRLQMAADGNLPQNESLGMNKVPVLDQGSHGTCVTFAVTGALDAILKKGDYISQLCSLQLGSYLEQHGYGISGWDGSYADMVISEIEQFGVINKKKQRELGCGGMYHYPKYDKHKSQMDPETYRSRSELVFGATANWMNIYHKDDAVKTLSEVKQALSEGDRLVFGVLLPRTDLGLAGAVAKHKTWFSQDTWVLTPVILGDLENIEAGHEMIITGYNDNAKATDNRGQKHTGLLTLRNSWGNDVGDNGDFYMSYDYFKLLAIEVQRISPVPTNPDNFTRENADRYAMPTLH